MKFYRNIKFVIFVIAGILVFVFNEGIMANNGALINGVVGASIAFFGLEGIIIPFGTKKYKEMQPKILAGFINVILAVVMIFFLEGNTNELRIVCVLWSVWSIMREGEEILEKGVHEIKDHPVTSALNFAESAVVIVFSIMLICAKDEHELLHHAHAHVVLLGIELIIEVIWEYCGEFEKYLIKKIKERKCHEENKQ